MRDLPIRIAITAAALLVVATGIVVAMVFLCLALYAALLLWLPPVWSALAAAGIVFVFSLLIVWLAGLLSRAVRRSAKKRRAKRGGSANLFTAELGRLLGEDAQSFIVDRPVLSLLLALIGGFAVGANPKLRAFLETFLKS
jgi:predicted neutral ceramidase superfamily lipid hydrolase